MKWSNIANNIPGCLGMCPEIAPVKFEISRQQKGSDVYSTVYRSELFYNGRTFTNGK
jgi:hypothetical protein